MSLPKEIRKQLKSFISSTTDETLDLIVNLTGKYIDGKKREKLKKESELEFVTKIVEAITSGYQMVLKLQEEYQQKQLDAESLKEKFYLVTDTIARPVLTEVPKSVHVMDYLFQVCEEMEGARFDFPYLKDTRYFQYLRGLKRLFKKLNEKNKIENKLWVVLDEFRYSKDAYTLVQATFQRLMNYYKFLGKNFKVIKKKEIDQYLKIYDELSGHYEKLIALVVVSLEILLTNSPSGYEDVRKRRLYENMRFVEKHRWRIFTLGFNRNIRNAIAHKTHEVDLIKETVDFYDVEKSFTLTFKGVQKETRELSALLLILPHMLISSFCVTILSIRDMLDRSLAHVHESFKESSATKAQE